MKSILCTLIVIIILIILYIVKKNYKPILPNPPLTVCTTDEDCPSDNVCISNICMPSPPVPFGPVQPDCVVNADCGPGMFCHGGNCVYPLQPYGPSFECQVDADCGSGTCQSGKCIAPIEPIGPSFECQVDADCSTGFACKSGQCVAEWQPYTPSFECQVDTDCPNNQKCVDNICGTPKSCYQWASVDVPDLDKARDFGRIAFMETSPTIYVDPNNIVYYGSTTWPMFGGPGSKNANQFLGYDINNNQFKPASVAQVNYLTIDLNDPICVKAFAVSEFQNTTDPDKAVKYNNVPICRGESDPFVYFSAYSNGSCHSSFAGAITHPASLIQDYIYRY